MRKIRFALAAGLCLLALAACGGSAAQPYTQEQAQEILDTFRRRHYCSPFYGPLRRRRLGAIQRLGRLYEKRHSRYLSLQQKYNRVNRLFFGTAY